MKILSYYNEFKNQYEHVYSCDMLRFNYVLFGDGADEFVRFLNGFNLQHGVKMKYYQNNKSVGYHYLWAVELEEDNKKCSFSFGCELNYKTENRNSGFIEFNPNKCMQLNLFQHFFEVFRSYCHLLELVRYDVAIDLPLPRSKVKMKRNSKSTYEYLYNEDKRDGLVLNSSVTEYQGRRNHNKFTKLYDKTKESKLDYDLTRIEFTFLRDEIKFANLPDFYIYDLKYCNNEILNSNLSNTQLVLIDLLRNSEDLNFYLKRLDYRTRKKIEPYLNDCLLKIDIPLINQVRDLALYFEI